MKSKAFLIVLFGILLSGCASVSDSPTATRYHHETEIESVEGTSTFLHLVPDSPE